MFSGFTFSLWKEWGLTTLSSDIAHYTITYMTSSNFQVSFEIMFVVLHSQPLFVNKEIQTKNRFTREYDLRELLRVSAWMFLGTLRGIQTPDLVWILQSIQISRSAGEQNMHFLEPLCRVPLGSSTFDAAVLILSLGVLRNIEGISLIFLHFLVVFYYLPLWLISPSSKNQLRQRVVDARRGGQDKFVWDRNNGSVSSSDLIWIYLAWINSIWLRLQVLSEVFVFKDECSIEAQVINRTSITEKNTLIESLNSS